MNLAGPAGDLLDATGPDTMAAVLADYGKVTKTAVRRYLATETPAPFLDDLLTDYPERGGKMMRPAICIANARVFGGRLEDAVGSAAAVEILHNALLIHDDIQDESELRRGRPTLHALHGVPLAINAGDAMMMAALRPLLDGLRAFSPSLATKILDVTQTMARETAEGQALELGWRSHNRLDITEPDYLTMVLKKTAWMGMIWPDQLGLLIGSRGEADPDSVVRFGFFLGAAFQIEDDLRNLSVDPGYGKEMNGDLLEGKRTLMLIHVRAACAPDEQRELDAFLGLRRENRTAEQVSWLADLMRRYGSIEHARTSAHALAGAAAYECDRLYGHLPRTADRDFLAGLVGWVFDRA